MDNTTAGYLVSGISRAILEQIEKILDAAAQPLEYNRRLLRNIESLRREKEYWKNFMEAEEWNREKVREVERSWGKRSQADQPTELACLEQLSEKAKEPVKKIPPNERPLRRSNTDPTDLLWVFRRRSTMLAYQPQECTAGRQNGCTEPWVGQQDEKNYGRKVSNQGKPCQGHKLSVDSQSSHEDPRDEVESSSDSEVRETIAYELEWTVMPLTHHDQPRRKISAPAYRPGRRDSITASNTSRRTHSVSSNLRRRRGSEAPALTVIARRRNSQSSLAYPVGLRRRNSRVTNTDNQLSIQAKAKHEMLANLVLPAFVDEPPTFRRERRNTFTYQATGSMRTKTDEKRYQVAKEILDTEKKYLSCLRALKEVFEGPIRENNLIPSKEIDVLFPGELLQILRSHTLFMKDLEERLQSWKLQGIVGDIFTKLSGSYHIDVLRIYSNYVNNFPRAIAVINKNLRGSHKFRKFLQNCSCNAECEGLDLPAFLLTPIQRLPRYVLLLRQLSKYTDPEHPDSFHIENALETMKQMINVLNDSIQSSCKLANNSQIRRSFKKKSLRKKGRELQKNRQNLLENERVSLDSSSVSTLSVDSPGPSSVCLLQDGSPEQSSTQLINGEHSTPSPLRNGEPRWRPVSSAELESYIERENQEEFSVITEENEDHKENKGSSHSKFRMAADSLIRNWQRRSKKWRRSAEIDEHERHEVTEPSAREKETEENHDTLDRNTEEICHESLKDENDNLNETPPKSPTGKSRKLAQVLPPLRTRPVSLVLTSESQLLNHQRKLKDKVWSDTDLSKDKSPDHSPEIWIPRQKKRVLQRTTSDGLRQVLRSRNSSLASGDTSSISGSKKSLSHVSQESLADSGVSETPGCSPSNTLNRRTRKVLSCSLTNVSATTETKKKLIQLNRRSWGEWVSAEMENEPSGSFEGRGCEPNEANTSVEGSGCEANEENMSKSKRKFRDVVKKLFASKKKGSLEETSSRKRTSESSPTEVGEKISTV